MDEVVNEVPVTEEPKVEEVVTESKPQPGDKTESALLLESLRKEREKRALLQEELEAERNKNQQVQGEVFSDEGKALLREITVLKDKLSSKEQAEIFTSVTTKYPVLNDKSAEFEQFQQDNPGMKLETAAKAFLIENDLLESPKPRKGLESSSGGGRAPVNTGMTAEDIDNLRINNYNEYARRVRAGTLNKS